MKESIIWRGGRSESIYDEFSIPGIVVTNKGTLLAYTEARDLQNVFFRWGDWAAIDIVMKRSTDGGETWSETKVLCNGTNADISDRIDYNHSSKMRTTNNAVMIVDGDSIHMLYSVWYGFERFKDGGVYYTKSKDDGLTWSEPRNISAMCHTDKYPHSLFACGPGHGIVLSGKSKNPGMLLSPVWMTPYTINFDAAMLHGPNVVSTIYSLDHGETWQVGEIIDSTDEVTCPNETVAVELSDGSVMFNSRNTNDERRRSVTISPTGYSDWLPSRFDRNLPDPKCFGSIIRYDKDTILFVNCDNDDNSPATFLAPRVNLTVRASRDDGKTWEASRVLTPGKAGYSDIAVGTDGMIYVLYDIEHGVESTNLFKFDLDWVYNNG